MAKKSWRRVLIAAGLPVAKFICGFDLGKPRNNKSPKDWDTGYELVVRFRYGLDESAIAKIAGLRNYDTGISMSGPDAGIRDLMFPCGQSLEVAKLAARRLYFADHFGALKLEISCPIEKIGSHGFQNWLDVNGKIIRRVKLLPKKITVVHNKKWPSRKVAKKTVETRLFYGYLVDPKTGKRLPAPKKRYHRGSRVGIFRQKKAS